MVQHNISATKSIAALRTDDVRIAQLVCISLCLVAYLPIFSAPFVFDDLEQIVQNTSIRSFAAWQASVFTQMRPICYFTLTANYALSGLAEETYHFFSIAVHLIAGLALFGIVRRTMLAVSTEPTREGTSTAIALSVSLIWLLHPLQTQTVSYIIQRCEGMMGMCYLLTLYCVLRSDNSPARWLWQAVAVVVCWLGMFSKEVMVTAPIVIALYDRAFLSSSWRELARKRGLCYLLFVAAAVSLCWHAFRVLSHVENPSAGFGHTSISMWEYARSQPGVIMHYLRLSVWPVGLCIDYRWPVATHWVSIYPAAMLLTAAFATSVVAYCYRPRLGFLGLSFFFILAPTSSVMPITDLAVEHRMYLPLAVLVVAAVLGVRTVCERLIPVEGSRRTVCAIMAITVVFVMLVGTAARNLDYANPVRLWTKATEKSPHNDRAWLYLARETALLGDRKQAIAQLRKVLELNPRSFRAYFNLGNCYKALEDFDSALVAYKFAIDIEPGFADAYVNLGNLHVRQDRFEDAVKCFESAVTADPSLPLARMNLGMAYHVLGRSREATIELRNAILLEPRSSVAARQLAWIFATAVDEQVRDGARSIEIAERLYRQSLKSRSYERAFDMDVLAAAYAEAGRFDDALPLAHDAHTMAISGNDLKRAHAIARRIELYKAGQAFRTNELFE